MVSANHSHCKCITVSSVVTRVQQVAVHFHVLSAGSSIAEGNVPDQWLHDQMSVLQRAHSSAGFVLTLATTSRTINARWYNMAQGSDEEVSPENLSHSNRSRL